uniref:Uncharacterized protein n=1 Tax=Myoviridae sp. ct1ba2 TaxID=2827654 RepID=A0A8S5S682_9CAUD|nr:MAG TPA: hypothetical protein [Myoviridae sp. ct1ba2]
MSTLFYKNLQNNFNLLQNLHKFPLYPFTHVL